MQLKDHIEIAIELAKSDERVWIRRELQAILNRLGTGAKSTSPKPKSNMVPMAYPGTNPHAGLNVTKKKMKEVAAKQMPEAVATHKANITDTLRNMTDDELKAHFGNAAAVKKFIISIGGQVHTGANFKQALAALSKHIGREKT